MPTSEDKRQIYIEVGRRRKETLRQKYQPKRRSLRKVLLILRCVQVN